jgi:hypothetical protein
VCRVSDREDETCRYLRDGIYAGRVANEGPDGLAAANIPQFCCSVVRARDESVLVMGEGEADRRVERVRADSAGLTS